MSVHRSQSNTTKASRRAVSSSTPSRMTTLSGRASRAARGSALTIAGRKKKKKKKVM